MINIRNIGKKIVSIGLGVLTADSWRIAKVEQNRANALNKLQSELDKLNQTNVDKDLMDSVNQTKIHAATGRIQESQSEIERLANKSNSIFDKINKGGLDNTHKEELLKDFSNNIERKTDLINKVGEVVKNINDTYSK